MSPELDSVVTQLVLEAWGYSLTADAIVDYVCARCDATPVEVKAALDELYADMRD
jgi:hypothetical protein